MNRLGIRDNTKGKDILKSHFNIVINDKSNIIREFKNKNGNFETRESLFIGPSGKAAKFESTWEILPNKDRRFITLIPYGGKK